MILKIIIITMSYYTKFISTYSLMLNLHSEKFNEIFLDSSLSQNLWERHRVGNDMLSIFDAVYCNGCWIAFSDNQS